MSPAATKEFILNYAMNRWQLNFKKNVGPTSDSIRKCCPINLKEWEEFYYSNVKSRDHISGLGETLFKKIKEELPGEERFHPGLLESITKADCINYMHDIVIRRTFDGYAKEHGR